ncbi:hypothetical protein, partial [Clostridium sp.]|uniref:hypothetical protein n=1 Tax=Clostridium sp. TaxID=1506 RepID=UPI0025802C38
RYIKYIIDRHFCINIVELQKIKYINGKVINKRYTISFLFLIKLIITAIKNILEQIFILSSN